MENEKFAFEVKCFSEDVKYLTHCLREFKVAEGIFRQESKLGNWAILFTEVLAEELKTFRVIYEGQPGGLTLGCEMVSVQPKINSIVEHDFQFLSPEGYVAINLSGRLVEE